MVLVATTSQAANVARWSSKTPLLVYGRGASESRLITPAWCLRGKHTYTHILMCMYAHTPGYVSFAECLSIYLHTYTESVL